uniref:Uncharacterized protein n=1 Tax=Meloidogyne enterolobii TaxID=390850 RepID=A0A6V7WQE2_MELEN|nr:unnamed protein product [Meloidogyne enterolobii]
MSTEHDIASPIPRPSLSLNSATNCECVEKLLSHTAKLVKRSFTSSSQTENTKEHYENKWAKLFKEYILNHEHCTNENCASHHDGICY